MDRPSDLGRTLAVRLKPGRASRTDKNFKLWRDKDALAAGEHWKRKLKAAVSESVFFIQIVSPSAINSSFCRFELDSFIERERKLGRDDLVFPLLYVSVPELDDERKGDDAVLSIIADRQYLDWRHIRHQNVNSTEVMQTVEQFCSTVAKKLREPWTPPEGHKVVEEKERARPGDGRASQDQERRSTVKSEIGSVTASSEGTVAQQVKRKAEQTFNPDHKLKTERHDYSAGAKLRKISALLGLMLIGVVIFAFIFAFIFGRL